MNEKVISQLLEDVRLIVASNRAENYRNGKEFNVFYIERIASDEVRICRLLRELLDPNGCHGQGDIFLRKFFESVLKSENMKFSDYDYKHAKVVCEESIDGLRRIDIVIRIAKRMIPIEVKIYADDQDRQCIDYYEYAVNFDKETKIYYLTLDGHEPSANSKCNLTKVQYKCLSFSKDILEWLDECIVAEEIEQIYSVREIIIQFRNILRDLTGKRGDKVSMEIKEKIRMSPDTVLAAMEIEKALPEVRAEKMNEIFIAIKEHMEKLAFGYCVESYKEEALQFYKNNKKTWPSLSYIIPLEDEKLNGKIALRFEIEERLYVGVCPWSGKNNWDIKKDEYSIEYVKKYLTPEGIKVGTLSSTWYWWKYLNFNDNVNFRYCNSDFINLFDKSGFDSFMGEAYSTMDSIVNYLKGTTCMAELNQQV